MSHRAVERRVLRNIQSESVLRAGDRILAAVSGGPDSTAHLLILNELRSLLSAQLVGVAYFHHGLRPEADEEAEFVRSLADRLLLPCVVGRDDVRRSANSLGISIEMAARQSRYTFLAEAASRLGATAVSTGHTADDQVETVLLHLLRGTGIRGLAGMQAQSSWPVGDTHGKPALIRPILALTKADAVDYCRELGIVPRTDSSNEDITFRRNDVRHRLLPMLRDFNPNIERAILDMSRSVSSDRETLDWLTGIYFERVAESREGEVWLDRSQLNAVPAGLRSRIAQRAMEEVSGSRANIPIAHTDAIVDLMGGRPGRQIFLPGGNAARSTYDHVVVGRRLKPQDRAPSLEQLCVPGVVQWAEYELAAEMAVVPENPGSDTMTAYLDRQQIGDRLTVRGRKPGDRLQPAGFRHERKLQDILVDKKVPRVERDLLPLVESEDGRLAWVVGIRVAEWARARPGHSAVRIRAQKAWKATN